MKTSERPSYPHHLAGIRARRAALRREINSYKESVGCKDCKMFYPHYVLDFDHLDGSHKLGSINSLIKAVSFDTVRKEMAKCEVVCANCHRERTHRRLQKP